MTSKDYCSEQTNNLDLEEETDEAIFNAFQQGNIQALEVIYHRYGMLVYRLVYRMLNNAQEAEDLTQEIFLSLQERPKYNPQRGSFYTYLMILARSRTIDRLRSQRSRGQLLQNIGKMKDSIDKSHQVNPTEVVAMNERAKQVRDALKDLSSHQRQVLELSYYQGLSQSEIAEYLNLPLGTVKTHSRRGLLKLKKNLQNIFS